jgi:serpin B
MHMTEHFRESADGGAQLLELPYAGGDLSMVVLLPTAPDGLPALEKTLSNERLTALLLRARSQKVDLTLPRFTLSDRHSLGPVLSAMGMPSAFSDLKADFSGITGKRGISITQVVHQANVEVDEKGTVAAAATGVTMGIRAVSAPVVFHADHPFIFLIRDVKSGSIIFLGRVVKPR